MLLDGLQVFDCVALRLLRAFQPINLVLTNTLDQLDSVRPKVSGLRHIAVSVALKVDVQRLKAQRRVASGWLKMAGCVLNIGRGSA